MSEADRSALLAGESVVGQFRAASGDGGVIAVPGVLTWAGGSGATLELVDDAPGFPRAFRRAPFVVHGVLRSGTDLTLLDARLVRITNGYPARVNAATLALGAFTDPNERWPRAIFSTAALSEWRNDTGIYFSRPARRKHPHNFRIDYKQPIEDVVEIGGAELTFTGHIKTSNVGYRPDFSMRNRGVMIVNSKRRRTISDLLDRHGQPLVALMSLAADRPDDVTQEVYLSVEQRRRIEVWRSGRTTREVEWRGRYLFAADELLDYPRAIRKWWMLHRQVWPATGLFGDHVRNGSTYSPSRFLTAYSALEVYGRVARKTTDLKRLREYAQVDPALIGCDNAALKLIKMTRGYFAHFNNVSETQRTDVEDNVLESTRRLAALTQACLLRELGLKKATRERLLTDHYIKWPLA